MIITKGQKMNKKKLEFLTVEEASEKLKVHWQTILNYIKSKQLRAYKVGKGYKIYIDDLMKFLEKRATK